MRGVKQSSRLYIEELCWGSGRRTGVCVGYGTTQTHTEISHTGGSFTTVHSADSVGRSSWSPLSGFC